jgi:hypothetical protein
MGDAVREMREIDSIGMARWNDVEYIGWATDHEEVAAHAAKRLVEFRAWAGVEAIAKRRQRRVLESAQTS